jgi:hypothetical protein
MNTRIAGLVAAIALAVGAPTAADAMTFLNAGDNGTATIFGYDKVTDQFVGSITADLTFTLVSKSADSKAWNFTYEADNTSTDQVARLVSFALSVDPNFKTVTGTTGAFTATKVTKIEDFTAELCFIGNNCNGGGSGGLTSAVANSIGAFTLNFQNAPADSVTFDSFAGKFQGTLYNGSSLFAKECPTGLSCGGGGNEVPEPGTWALMIMGFGAASAMLRRRRTVLA